MTETTWKRFLDPAEPVHALVAQALYRKLAIDSRFVVFDRPL